MRNEMSDLLVTKQESILTLTLNRPELHNAFDDKLINLLCGQLESAQNDESVRVIILNANGKSFSAGADLNWMQSMVNYSEQENIDDSLKLANLMHMLHHSSKPTIACVQGVAFGGGAGLAAACDIAIGSIKAQFCFSEVKLGLIPAVISPYVIKTIGARHARRYFLSAELIDADKALAIGLLNEVVDESLLEKKTLELATKIAKNAPVAMSESKALIDSVYAKQINEKLIEQTANWIAKVRVSKEGQQGLSAFLTKTKPHWV